MSELHGFDDADKERVLNIACNLIAGQIEAGTLQKEEAAIKAAMPQAIRDAKVVAIAANEMICG